MATAADPLSLAEYLTTEYEPDCEYVDGMLLDRNVGKKKHSTTQGLLVGWLLANKAKHGHQVLPEQRVQVSRSRVRVPDVCLVGANDTDEVTERPFPLWIEVLSPEDRWSRIQLKLNDVLRFGVETVWIIDPYSREAWIATQAVPVLQVEDGLLRCAGLRLEIPLVDILPEE